MRLLISCKCLVFAGIFVVLAGCAGSDSDTASGPSREQAFTFIVMGDNRPKHSDPSLPQLELFIDAAQTGSVAGTIQLSVNPAGVAYDAKGEDPKWNKPWTHVAPRERNAWTLELAIPWKSLEIPPPPTLVPGDILVDDRAIRWNVIDEHDFNEIYQIRWYRLERIREQSP